jgi:hypothetical protein
MRKPAFVIVPTLLFILTTLIGLLFLSRLGMKYNSEGNYFDEESTVVYHEQSVLIFGLLFLACLLTSLLTARKLKANFNKSSL